MFESSTKYNSHSAPAPADDESSSDEVQYDNFEYMNGNDRACKCLYNMFGPNQTFKDYRTTLRHSKPGVCTFQQFDLAVLAGGKRHLAFLKGSMEICIADLANYANAADPEWLLFITAKDIAGLARKIDECEARDELLECNGTLI